MLCRMRWIAAAAEEEVQRDGPKEVEDVWEEGED